MMNKETKFNIRIAEAAARRYVLNRRFTVESLADVLDAKPQEISSRFPTRSAMISYFYESRMILYKEQVRQISEYSEYTLQEKVSHLFLTLLDLFQEYREFVLMTYKPVIVFTSGKTDFEQRLQTVIRTIFETDSSISPPARIFLNSCLYNAIRWHFHALMGYWSRDGSTRQENTLALTDKWSSFVEELFYSNIAGKGFDLMKFLYRNPPFSSFAISDVHQSEGTGS